MGTAPETIQQRKTRHLEICANPGQYDIERSSNGLEDWRLNHRALPELSWDELDTSFPFLGYSCKHPLFISCMTGGSAGALKVNQELALAAERFGLAVGTGSIRVLLRHPENLQDFRLKQWAPSVPLLANIGAVVVRDTDSRQLVELVRRTEADALVVHLNPGQELFQGEGDRDFRGLKQALTDFIDSAPFPVIVKETGFGLAPEEAEYLLTAGAAYIDVAGRGGANWIRVEAYRDEQLELAAEFDHWGYRTADLVRSLAQHSDRILASGGLRTGSDCAKALALGAAGCGMATPLVRALAADGPEGLDRFLATTLHSLRLNLLLTGSRNIGELRRPGVLRPAAQALP